MKRILVFLSLSLMISSCEVKNQYGEFDKANHLKPKINKADFYRLTGFDLGWHLLEPITIAKSADEEPELSKRLSPGQKALYFWWYLDAEVTNGGFIQFYYNGMENYVPAIIAGMELIGDQEMADLVKKSKLIYETNIKTFEAARSNDGSTDKFSELYDEITDLLALDDIYYSLHDQTMSRIEKYARAHSSEFCVDEDGNEFKENFTGVVKTYYKNGILKDSLNLVNGVVDGTLISYYENGKEQMLNTYKNGVQTGEQKSWYEHGTLQSRLTIDIQGNRIVEQFFPNGQMHKIEHTDKNEERKGMYKEWYDNGQLKEQAEYIAAIERIGPWIKFHKNGQKEMDAEFKNGDVFIHNYWTAEGKQLLTNGTGLYINEFELEMRSDTTRYRYETEYKNYKRHGMSKSFAEGMIRSTQQFKDGVEHGKSESFKDGKLVEEKVYEDGKLISTKKVD